MKIINIEQTNRASDLAKEIKALMPHERLRLAADLLERRQPKLAQTIAQSALDELALAIAAVEVAKTERPARESLSEGEVKP